MSSKADNPGLLLLEDDDDFRRTLQDVLEFSNFSVLPARSCEQARTLIGERPELAVVDLQLPDGRGTDFVAELRDRYPDLPVIMLTGDSSFESVREAMRAGTADYMVKPVKPSELLRTIGRVLARADAARSEADLRAREERYRSIFDESPAAHVVLSADGFVVACNTGFAEILGDQSPSELMGCPLGERVLDVSGARVRLGEELVGGETRRAVRLKLVRDDGTHADVLATLQGAPDDEGRVTEVRGYLMDITEQQRLEERVQHGAVMDAVGRLTGGVAHQFNNMLMVVQGHVEFLRETARGAAEKEHLDRIEETVAKAGNLNEKLLIYTSHDWGGGEETLDLVEFVRQSTDLLRSQVPESVGMRLDLPEGRLVVRDIPGKLQLVLAALANNAVEAAGEGVSITVSLDRVELTGESTGLPEGGYASLVFADDGPGFAPDIQDRAFEPFVTDKPKAQGMGLAVVYGTLRSAGGLARIRETESGAAVELLWPLQPGRPEIV